MFTVRLNWSVVGSTAFLLFLNKAVTFAKFQSCGTSPLINDLLNSSATVLKITSDNSVNILDPTESIPGALFTFNSLSFVLTMSVSNYRESTYIFGGDNRSKKYLISLPSLHHCWQEFFHLLKDLIRVFDLTHVKKSFGICFVFFVWVCGVGAYVSIIWKPLIGTTWNLAQ